MSETSKKSFIWGSDTTQANNSNSDNDVIEYTNNHIYFYAKINKENICKLNKLIYLVSEELKKINNTYDTQVVIYLHIGLFKHKRTLCNKLKVRRCLNSKIVSTNKKFFSFKKLLQTMFLKQNVAVQKHINIKLV